MSTIITEHLDLEHWSPSQSTGPVTMIKAMHACDTSSWKDKETSTKNLIDWWTMQPPYDPDFAPEQLITRVDLTPFMQEVFGVAAMHRIRPAGLLWEKPTPDEIESWQKSWQAKIMRLVLNTNSEPDWWQRCLFEGLDELYIERTEHLAMHAMQEHSFIHIADSMGIPLKAFLTSLQQTPACNTKNTFVLPDMC